jgi:hypothetical protein
MRLSSGRHDEEVSTMRMKENDRLTVKEVIKILSKLDQDREIVCAIDDEWNEIRELAIDTTELKEVVFFPV